MVFRDDGCVKQVLVKSPGFPQQAFYPVAIYSVAKFLFGHGKAYPDRGWLGTTRQYIVDNPYRKNRKRFSGVEKRINMLLSLEPLVCFESIANGQIF